MTDGFLLFLHQYDFAGKTLISKISNLRSKEKKKMIIDLEDVRYGNAKDENVELTMDDYHYVRNMGESKFFIIACYPI